MTKPEYSKPSVAQPWCWAVTVIPDEHEQLARARATMRRLEAS